MNGLGNCIYAICCPPGSDQRRDALAKEMEKSGMGASIAATERVVFLRSIAAWVLKNFDLAPPGSLQTFKDEIAKMAREGHVKE